MASPDSKPVHPCLLDEATLLQQCQLKFTRRSGPGGQHRNKTSTAAVLTHLPTDVCAEASERRSQAQNRAMALQRLRVQLALQCRGRPACDDPLDPAVSGPAVSGPAVSGPAVAGTTVAGPENADPNDAFRATAFGATAFGATAWTVWQQRMLASTQFVSPQHWDFPVLLVVALDTLHHNQYQLAPAAQSLQVSTARLSKLLRLEPLVLAWVNQQRKSAGLGQVR